SPAYEDEVTDEVVENIGIARRLHDVGRFLMSKEEIADDGGPDRQNLEYIKKCTEFGCEVVGEFGGDQESGGALEMTRQIARCHHAHWDGSGYPALSGSEIPLEARIAAVANDFDEMTAPAYGEAACSREEGQKRISERSGTYYDPDVIQVFDKLWNRMRTN
ncbi:MAG: HD domain-containing protein, partial [Lachnospiraceae bacterium]|nr:HD domain-containing protein [Lachnospiraceae bacterium]